MLRTLPIMIVRRLRLIEAHADRAMTGFDLEDPDSLPNSATPPSDGQQCRLSDFCAEPKCKILTRN
jgi:hypothetical protein